MSHKNLITAALVTGTLLFTACGGESHHQHFECTGHLIDQQWRQANLAQRRLQTEMNQP